MKKKNISSTDWRSSISQLLFCVTVQASSSRKAGHALTIKSTNYIYTVCVCVSPLKCVCVCLTSEVCVSHL